MFKSQTGTPPSVGASSRGKRQNYDWKPLSSTLFRVFPVESFEFVIWNLFEIWILCFVISNYENKDLRAEDIEVTRNHGRILPKPRRPMLYNPFGR